MAVAVGVGGGDKVNDEGDDIEGGGASAVVEEGAEVEGEGGLLMVTMSSLVHPLFFSTSV